MKSILGAMAILGAVVLIFILYMGATSYGDVVRYMKARKM